MLLKLLENRARLLLWFFLLALAIHIGIDIWALERFGKGEAHPVFGNVNLIRAIIHEERPNLEGWYLVKIFLSFCSALFLFLALIGMADRTRSRSSLVNDKLLGWELGALGIACAVSIILLAILAYSPRIFFAAVNEDGIIEWLSAIMWFVACALFARVCLISRRNRDGSTITFMSFGLAFFSFVCGMEEVSWFQRVVEIETPELLQGNRQGEFNLHNFLTNPLENAFYFSVFVLFIMVPFANEQTGLIKKSSALTVFIPRMLPLLACTILVAYNYDMWNIAFTQLSFFITLLILAYYYFATANSHEPHRNSWLIACFIGHLLIAQGLILVLGDDMVRRWDITEAKEFFIALTFLIYATHTMKIYNTARKQRTAV